MKPILEIKHISKKFRIEHNRGTQRNLRETLMGMFEKKGSRSEDFYALKDVSFDVSHGESLGIIGKNGAGKSTLLKILSKITPPTSGSIISRGRIASLLEVGTGFHPELTGRENIFLNGSLLGMKSKEIQSKFDEIIAFSGTEKFLDTPLKHYSSGMQLRLAFSVASFLEPEILVIDEVLAVGDSEFQKKCLGKMQDINKSGRTILFVSHDLNAVQNLCSSAILLQKGKVITRGNAEKIVSAYLQTSTLATTKWEQTMELTSPHFKRISVQLEGRQPELRLIVNFSIITTFDMIPSFVAFDISSKIGTPLGQAIPQIDPFIKGTNEESIYSAEIELSGFVPGDYFIDAWFGPHYSETYDWQKECIEFSILESPQKNRTFPHPSSHGFFVPKSRML
jgi:lipopolysaccharide transport system ATP-binding protein